MSQATGLSFSGNLRREARVIGLPFASTTSMIGAGCSARMDRAP